MIPIVAILGGVLVSCLKIIFGEKRNTNQTKEDTQMIQEIYRGLQKMEKRIETLETLVIQSKSKEDDLERAFRDLEK